MLRAEHFCSDCGLYSPCVCDLHFALRPRTVLCHVYDPYPQALVDMAAGMLAVQPGQRPTAEYSLEHPFFREDLRRELSGGAPPLPPFCPWCYARSRCSGLRIQPSGCDLRAQRLCSPSCLGKPQPMCMAHEFFDCSPRAVQFSALR